MTVAMVAALSAPARADHCAAPPGASASLEQIDAMTRLRYIDGRLRESARRTRIWAWGWAGIYSTLTAVNLAQIPFSSDEDRKDQYLGAAASFVGVAVLAILPRKVFADQRWLERRIRTARPGTDPCVLLSEAERLFQRDVDDIHFGTGPLVGAGNILFNIGVSLVAGLVLNHWDQAAILGIVGTSIGALQTGTSPRGLVADLERYRRGDLSVRGKPPSVAFSMAPMLGQRSYGLTLGLTF
jgi:hypothetical protein